MYYVYMGGNPGEIKIMDNIIKDIYEHIRKAETEAVIRNIKANQIIIDKDLAITNNLYIQGIEIE